MVFTRVIHDEVCKQLYDNWGINLLTLAQRSQFMMAALIIQYGVHRRQPLHGHFIPNLIEACDGYTVILSFLVGHAVENSRSLLSMRGVRDAENAVALAALRRGFQLKDFPSDSCCPIASAHIELIKSIFVLRSWMPSVAWDFVSVSKRARSCARSRLWRWARRSTRTQLNH